MLIDKFNLIRCVARSIWVKVDVTAVLRSKAGDTMMHPYHVPSEE